MKKLIAGLVIVFVMVGAILLGVGLRFEYQQIDMVYVNEVKQCIVADKKPEKIVYDYICFNKSGKVISSTIEVDDMEIATMLSKAYANGDMVVEWEDNEIIFYLDSDKRFYAMRNTLIWIVFGSFILMGILIAVGCYLIFRRTIKPFNSLKSFAEEVANGNLDSPLILDKYMSFGAFGEAFDIMRNNLRESRMAEQTANLERSRLLQEIGHEIKTPLSTIKAIAECGLAVENNKDYNIILDKSNAIDNLVNDFYHKALEEEGQMNVYITKHSISEIKDIILHSDYNGKVIWGEIANCHLLYDKIRMAQIVDNIIANSYKYADSDIKVDAWIEEDMVNIRFKDFGEGVASEQLSYIMDRFYRGEKTEEKIGQGLGLNICRRLISRMGGKMDCYNDDGFVVVISLRIFNSMENN